VSLEKLASREKRASIAIGITFIILALTVASVALVHLWDETSTGDAKQLILISIPRYVKVACVDLCVNSTPNPPLLLSILLSE
jgi:hypothetical protein